MISKEESLALRGVCISLVVLHNLVHNVVPFLENEKWFNQEYAELFLTNVAEYPILATLSYVGWMGVPIFFFFCGYGLKKKYGDTIPDKLQFVKKHYLKLLFLFGPIVVINSVHAHVAVWDILGQLTFLNNMFSGSRIHPAAFWYVRCAFEFYILYGLILYRVKPKYLLLLGVIICALFIVLDDTTVKTIKYHSIGWFLDFAIGCYVATTPKSLRFLDKKWIFPLFIILVISTVQRELWVISDALMILFLLSIRKYLTNKVLLYVGMISAYLYAIHPPVRNLWLYLKIDYMTDHWYIVAISVLAYFTLCLLFAYAYRFTYCYIESKIRNLHNEKNES